MSSNYLKSTNVAHIKIFEHVNMTVNPVLRFHR